MSKFSDQLATFCARHRFVVLTVVLAITAFSLVGHFDPTVFTRMVASPSAEETNSGAVEEESDESEDAAASVSPISLSNSNAVLVIESSDFFTRENIAALRAVAEDLEALDEVSSVLWLDRVPILNIFGLPEPLLPNDKASDARFARAREKSQAHPLVGGQLLSDDARTMLMLIRFDFYFVFDDAQVTTGIRERAEQTAARFPGADLRFRVTGRIPTAIDAIASHEANQLRYQLFGYGMILVMSLILFRGIRAVIIVALAPLFGVFWTLGIIQFFGYDNNPLIDVILPILVSLVGLTDGVHLMVQIRKLRADGVDRLSAATRGLRQVGLACFLTSLTTAIGFGSLMLADSEWVQQFGLCSMIGVLLCFIAVVTIIPLACSSWLGNGIEVGQESSLIDRNLNRIGGLIDLILDRKRLFATVGIILTIALIGRSLTLRPDQRQSNGLPENAESTQALFHVDKAFGGLEFASVDVRWKRSIDSDSPEILAVVTKVDDMLRSEELIGHPLSIRNLIDAQPGSGPPEERMTLLDLLPPPLKRAFFAPDRRQATVNFRVQDLGIATYGPVFKRIESQLVQISESHPEFELGLSGSAVRRWRSLYQVVVDLAASLGTASVIIWLVLTIVFRSIRLGLISIVPNLFPLAFAGAYLAFAGYNLEVVMVCNFTVCLGIAVDDTIHFMTRYLEEQEKTKDTNAAIRNAFTGVGTALIMTTSVLVAGFGVVMFSDSRDHHIFATMGAITVGSALFCDLIFLPALLAVFSRK